MSDNNSTVLTPEVKQVASLLQNGDPRRRFGLYVRSKMLSMMPNRNNQQSNFTKLANEELGPAYDLGIEAGLAGGMYAGRYLGDQLVRKARLFTPRSAFIGTAVPTAIVGFGGALAAGALVSALESRGKLPAALSTPQNDIHRGGGVVGGRAGALAGLARGLYVAGTSRGSLPFKAMGVLGAVGTGHVLGKAIGQIGGYYVSQANEQDKADDQSQDIETGEQYTGQQSNS